MNKSIKILTFSIVCLMTISCVSTNQGITLGALKTSYPISASSALYDRDRIKSFNELLIVKRFTLTKRQSVPVHSGTVPSNIQPDLDKLIKENNGDGIIQFTVKPKNVNASVFPWIEAERWTGSFLTAAGGLALIFNNVFPPKEDVLKNATNITGGIALGLGVLAITGSYLHEYFGTIDYDFEFSGAIVKFQNTSTN